MAHDETAGKSRAFCRRRTKLMSDKRAGARLVDRRSTRRVPSRDGQAQKRPQASFSNGLESIEFGRADEIVLRESAD
jgi:hypothetical protein